jgi:hypothetical protein
LKTLSPKKTPDPFAAFIKKVLLMVLGTGAMEGPREFRVTKRADYSTLNQRA